MVNDIMLKGLAFVSNAIASFKEEHGQDIMEYALLAGAIGLLAAGAFYFGGNKFDFGTFRNKINDCLTFNKTDCGS